MTEPWLSDDESGGVAIPKGEARACPFCGVDDLRFGGSQEAGWYVQCVECNAYGPSPRLARKASALGVWNQRSADDRT